MGQMVAVTEKPSSLPSVVRYETNRSLTGMGHERFRSVLDAVGPRPAAELARRLFATGKVGGVHIYANVITVDLEKGFDASGLGDVIRGLYQYWKPGVTPPSFDDLVETPAVGEVPAGGDGGGGGGDALSEAAKRIPPLLLERSRAALAKWKATHGG